MKNFKGLLYSFLIFVVLIACINLIVVLSTEKQILKADDKKLLDADYILVLGAAVWKNKYPSFILEERLLEGVNVFKMGASKIILLSGDHGKTNYDEVSVMESYTLGQGIPSENILLDKYGFSTYASCYNAKQKFKAKKIIIVTQKYHLHRAVYIAKAFGMDAYGVASDRQKIAGAFSRSFREVFARVKDFGMCIFKPVPSEKEE
ncbi:MAG: ElyC/SanA/YdcF family protein [Treponemataceae bacterium]